MKRFVAKPRKLDMHEIMTQGMNDLAAGMYVEGQGWVGPNDPRDHFGECQEKLTEMWGDILRDLAHGIAVIRNSRLQYDINHKTVKRKY